MLARTQREASTADSEKAPTTPPLLQIVDLALRRVHPDEHLSPAQTIVRAVEQIYENGYSTRLSITGTARQAGVSRPAFARRAQSRAPQGTFFSRAATDRERLRWMSLVSADVRRGVGTVTDIAATVCPRGSRTGIATHLQPTTNSSLSSP